MLYQDPNQHFFFHNSHHPTSWSGNMQVMWHEVIGHDNRLEITQIVHDNIELEKKSSFTP